jgi:hypothetical protein
MELIHEGTFRKGLEMETSLLLTMLCAGCGYFLTTHFERLLKILGLMDLYDGRKARNTALLGLGIGAFTSFVGHRPDELGYWLSVANGTVWTMVGGFILSAIAAQRRPVAFAKYAFLVDHLALTTSDLMVDIMEDPVRLQAHLDRTYGKGLVNAKAEIEAMKKRHGTRAGKMTLEGAARAIELLERNHGKPAN